MHKNNRLHEVPAIKVGTISPGTWHLEPELLMTLMSMSKQIGVSAGLAYLKTDKGILTECHHILFWFLLPHMCLAGAIVIGQYGKKDQYDSHYYDIYLRGEDDIHSFCYRLKNLATYELNLPSLKTYSLKIVPDK